MPQTRAYVRRSKGKDRRYKLNDGALGLSRRRLAPGAARRGARGVAGGGQMDLSSLSYDQPKQEKPV
jgi:hypothetical protein